MYNKTAVADAINWAKEHMKPKEGYTAYVVIQPGFVKQGLNRIKFGYTSDKLYVGKELRGEGVVIYADI